MRAPGGELLALLDLVGRRWLYGFAGVVTVEGQRDVLAASLRFDVLDGIAVALPDIGVEGVAVLVFCRGVPGLTLRQILLTDVFLIAGAGERRRIDARAALGRCPFRRSRAHPVIRTVDGDLLDRHGLSADVRLEHESTGELWLVDQRAVSKEGERHAAFGELTGDLEMRVFQIRLLRLRQHLLRGWRSGGRRDTTSDQRYCSQERQDQTTRRVIPGRPGRPVAARSSGRCCTYRRSASGHCLTGSACTSPDSRRSPGSNHRTDCRPCPSPWRASSCPATGSPHRRT